MTRIATYLIILARRFKRIPKAEVEVLTHGFADT